MTATAPRDSAAFEVREALGQAGCPVCRLALRAVGRLLQSVAYEQVNDPGLRSDLRATRGFCNTHAYRWLREARSALGTAIIYRDVVRAALRDLSVAGAPAAGGFLGTLLGRSPEPARARACPACRAQRQAEDRYLEALLAILADPAEAKLLEHADGLCLGHSLTALHRGGPAAGRIEEHTRRAVLQLLGELDEVVRKEDYRFRHEPRTDAERTAPGRAVAWAAGAEGLVEG
jgi:hypothetical protein